MTLPYDDIVASMARAIEGARDERFGRALRAMYVNAKAECERCTEVQRPQCRISHGRFSQYNTECRLCSSGRVRRVYRSVSSRAARMSYLERRVAKKEAGNGFAKVLARCSQRVPSRNRG
jgi:hypothetical protein